MDKRKILIVLVILALAAGGCFLGKKTLSRPKEMASVSRTAVEMGTVVSLTLYGEGRSEETARAGAAELTDELIDGIDELDRSVFSWRSESSEVHRFNEWGTEPFPMSSDLADAVRLSLELASRTEGAMDITLRPLIALWGIENHDNRFPYEPPAEDEIAGTAASIGYQHLTIADGCLRKDDPAVQLDLGAVGKGYALDLALRTLLPDDRVTGAVVAAGGSVLAYGAKGEPWRVAIRDPEGSPADYLGILSVPGEKDGSTFISTSGGYEKFVEYDGKIFGHIIDGRTLHPAENELLSVSIVSHDSGLASDGLSTACFILGPEPCVELLDEYNAEAVFVFRDRSILLSKNLQERFEVTAPAYSVSGTLEENFPNER